MRRTMNSDDLQKAAIEIDKLYDVKTHHLNEIKEKVRAAVLDNPEIRELQRENIAVTARALAAAELSTIYEQGWMQDRLISYQAIYNLLKDKIHLFKSTGTVEQNLHEFDMAISNFEGPAQAIDGFAKFCSKVRKEITPYLEAYNKEQKHMLVAHLEAMDELIAAGKIKKKKQDGKR